MTTWLISPAIVPLWSFIEVSCNRNLDPKDLCLQPIRGLGASAPHQGLLWLRLQGHSSLGALPTLCLAKGQETQQACAPAAVLKYLQPFTYAHAVFPSEGWQAFVINNTGSKPVYCFWPYKLSLFFLVIHPTVCPLPRAGGIDMHSI